MNLDRSRQVFDEARRLIPGGDNSPVRAYRGVGGTPVHVARGRGCRVTDLDGNEYVDLVLSYGPLIVGHAHPKVVAAIERAARDGTAFGAPTVGELEKTTYVHLGELRRQQAKLLFDLQDLKGERERIDCIK